MSISRHFDASMPTLAALSGLGLIVPELQSRQPTAVIRELCQALEREGCVSDSRVLYDAIIQRELLGNTACEPGWALPHARLEGLAQIRLALGRCTDPLAWFGAAQPVRLVFLFAVPDVAAASYLCAVSGLARLAKDRKRVEQLLHAPDRESLLRVLDEIDLRRPRLAGAEVTSAG
jgi:mannitol/fructose-specific phosphotransferase system IIA component (Ntr-type)